MTDPDTRDALTLLVAAFAVLTPIALLGVIAALGTSATPSGFAILLFSVPAAFMVLVLVTGARLARRH